MKTRLTTTTTAAVITIAMGCCAVSASATTCGETADAAATVQQTPSQRLALACLINQTRAQHHLRRLGENQALANAATRYSQRLVAGRFFAHEDVANRSTIESRAKAYTTGAYVWALGENLAWATGYRSSPSQILALWMASPGHRANLLDPQWREIGIGIASGTPVGANGATYSVEFGTKIEKRRPHRPNRRRA